MNILYIEVDADIRLVIGDILKRFFEFFDILAVIYCRYRHTFDLETLETSLLTTVIK